jgi:hypothetical protein
MKHTLTFLALVLVLSSCRVKNESILPDESFSVSDSQVQIQATTHDWENAILIEKYENPFDGSYLYIVGKIWPETYGGCGGFKSSYNCYFYQDTSPDITDFSNSTYLGNTNPWYITPGFEVDFLSADTIEYKSWMWDGWSGSATKETVNFTTGKIDTEYYNFSQNNDGETEIAWPFYSETMLEK